VEIMKREEMDGLIRDTLQHDVLAQEPAVQVRDELLARARAHNDAQAEAVVGASIPPLVNGLRDKPTLSSSVHLPELDVELVDFFGTAQQRLMAVWMLSGSSRY
jgi:hypothetical protein